MYELEQLADAIEAAREEIKSSVGQAQLAVCTAALARLRAESIAPADLARVVKEVSNALRSAAAADESSHRTEAHAVDRKTLELLRELEARMNERDDLFAEFDAIPEKGIH